LTHSHTVEPAPFSEGGLPHPELPHDGSHLATRARDGRSPLERYAVSRMATDVAAMPASDVVQLVLWPETVAHWARDAGIATAVAYNMLSRFKPYRRVRELLARRLDVPGFVLDHLVDAARPLPSVLRAPEAGAGAGTGDLAEPPRPPRGDELSPTLRLPAVRDGSNPLEQRAVWRVWRDAAALPASTIVQIALFPETLAEWARRRRVPPSALYALLAGTQPNPGVRELLAQRLGVAPSALATLIDRVRREPAVPAPRELAPPPSEEIAPVSDRGADPAASAGAEPQTPAAGDQLTLGF
jgi:hypothetical protein